MANLVSFSGGKDSTCMLLMMLERGIAIDEIIFCDTGMEFPEMYKHIAKVEKCIGRKITRLKADKSFEYYMFEHVKTRGKNKGKCGYGWADFRNRWCTTLLKNDVLHRHYAANYQDCTINEYVGIAFDEQKRVKGKHYPLIEWGVTEAQALRYCYDKGFTWGGLYEHFSRVSCWCCPLKNQKELKELYHHYPKLWEWLKDMDARAYNRFKDKYSVAELEEKFKREDMQVDLF